MKKQTTVSEYFKAWAVIAKKALVLVAIKLFMIFFAALLFVQNAALNVILGVLVTAAECALLFFTGRGQARDEFKYIRINKSKYPDGVPLSQKARETSIAKAGYVAGSLVLFYSVFTVLGAALPQGAEGAVSARLVFQGIMKFGYSGITMICAGFNLTQTLIDSGGVFFAFFFVGVLLVAAAYFTGYFLSAKLRFKQHAEIQDEIKQFEEMGRIGRKGKK
ncbi:MAG: hypothetical protein LBL66_00095 [Clostridiales bacterium]|jgi:hypothetical protein|nr:hypothetical protein [Clostridiales bacterium]